MSAIKQALIQDLKENDSYATAVIFPSEIQPLGTFNFQQKHSGFYLLNIESDVRGEKIERYANYLSNLHKGKGRTRKSSFYRKQDSIELTLLSRFLEDVPELIKAIYPKVPHPFQLGMLEISSFINNFFHNKPNLIFDRGMSGYIKSNGLVEDILAEVATVIIKMEIQGLVRVSREFEKSYFSKHVNAFDEDYLRLYLITIALEEAVLLHNRGHIEQSIQYLSLACRYMLAYQQCPFIIVGEKFFEGKSELINNIINLIFGVYFSTTENSSYQLFSEIELMLTLGIPIVLEIDSQSTIECFQVARLHEKFNAPTIFLQSEPGAAFNFFPHTMPKANFKKVPLEPSLSLAELALFIVKQL
jgi:hypothetical protein